MGEIKSSKSCLVCLNSSENVKFVPIEESQKILNVCCSYVKDSINIEFLVKNISANNELSLCKICLDIALNLSQLVEQLSTLKKEITEVTDNFSEIISKRRCQAITNIIKQHNLINATTTSEVNVSNVHSQLNLEVLSAEKEISDEYNNCETSNNHLIINPNLGQVEESENEHLKYEIFDAVSNENEAELSTNLFSDGEENTDRVENDFMNNEGESATDDLQENNAVSASKIITCDAAITKSKKLIACSTNSALVVNFDKVPKIILERIPDQVKNVNSSPTSLTSIKDKHGSDSKSKFPGNGSSSGNSPNLKFISRNPKMKMYSDNGNGNKKYRKLTNSRKHPFLSTTNEKPLIANKSQIHSVASDNNNHNIEMESDNVPTMMDTESDKNSEQTELEKNVHMTGKDSSGDLHIEEVASLCRELPSVKNIESVHESHMPEIKVKGKSKPITKNKDGSKIYVVENGQTVTFYRCKACEEKFRSRAPYRKHRKAFELAKGPYPCGFCERSWSRVGDRLNHWKFSIKCGDLHRADEGLRPGPF